MGGIGDWSTTMWCVVLGCTLLLSSAIPFTYLLRTYGKRRKMTQQEVTDRIMKHDIGDEPQYVVASGAGERIEANVNIDILRKAAERGDWVTFWSWPLAFFGFFLGPELLFIALGLRTHDLVLPLLGGLGLVPMSLSGFFMAWAAIYTDIDRSSDEAPAPDATAHSVERR